MKPNRTYFQIVALSLILGGTVQLGCGKPEPTGTANEDEKTAQATSEVPLGKRVDLVEIPSPALDRLNPDSAERIQEQRQAVDRLLSEERSGASIATSRLARAFGEAGRLYQAHELFEAAVAAYENARRLEPADDRWPYLQGHSLRGLGRLEDAASAFATVVERSPNDLPAQMALGETYLQLGQLDRAREILRSAVESNEAVAFAQLKLAEVLLASGNAQAAVEHFRHALALQPEATVIHYPLAGAYRALGDIERAEEHLAQRGDRPVRFDDPLIRDLRSLTTGSQQHLNAGGVAFDRGDFAAAASAFEAAVEAEPTNALAHLNLASALAQLGRIDEAEAKLRQTLELDPRSASAQFNLGTLLASQNRLPEAIEAYRSALLIDPGDLSARFNLANALRRAGRNAESRQAFEGVLELDPANSSAHLAIVMSLVADNGCRAALDRLTASRAALVSDRSLIAAEVRLLAACPDAAVRDGEAALRLAQSLVAGGASIGGLESLAMAHAEVGDFERAVAAQERALVSARGRAIAAVVEGLERTLASYRQGRPCRDPWPATPFDGIS